MSPEPSNLRVGPVLESGDAARAVIDAIRERHPEAEVQDQGSYLRVLCPRRCSVAREAIERRLGRGFTLPGELEQIMPSFRGNLRIDEDHAEWSLDA